MNNNFYSFHLNCWKVVKLAKRQRKDERSLSVSVAKAEKIRQMVYG